MEIKRFKEFAMETRQQLLTEVAARLEQVRRTDSVEQREKQGVVDELNRQIAAKGKEGVINEMAYLWFNRLCALRYMDVNHYTDSGIVSPQAGFTQPEILQDAKQGIFDEDWRLDNNKVRGLLNGSVPSTNPEQEAYRILLVAGCNHYAQQMEFLFEAAEDYSELLMPEDLLSTQSVLHAVQKALTPEICAGVEVIGLLYQLYVVENKQEYPKNTQFFTPNWIGRYLVQNSLGRLWLYNHPDSRLANHMEYYVQPDPAQEINFSTVDSPEEITFLDPACGSGQILAYAFELLYAIYEEQGYDAPSIPKLILEKNLHGIEIDKRAAQWAGFTLMMQARARDRRFFRRNVQPRILEMVDVVIPAKEAEDFIDQLGDMDWKQTMSEGLKQFEHARAVGSLIRPVIQNSSQIQQTIEESGLLQDLTRSSIAEQIKQVLKMSEILSHRYHVVVNNPPSTNKRKTAELKRFARENYPDSFVDTQAMFMERNLKFARVGGIVGMVMLEYWMYFTSFKKVRLQVLNDHTLLGMAHLGKRAFETLQGQMASTTMFTMTNRHQPDYVGEYFRLVDGKSEIEKQKALQEAIVHPDCGWFYRVSAAGLKKIPDAPISYETLPGIQTRFDECASIGEVADLRTGMTTKNDNLYVRCWYEISINKLKTDAVSKEDLWTAKSKKWVPFTKGGEPRKWSGNSLHVVNLAKESYSALSSTSENYYFQEYLTWSAIASGTFRVRYFPKGSVFSKGALFETELPLTYLGCFLGSSIAPQCINALNPTFQTNQGDVARLPIIKDVAFDHKKMFHSLSRLSKTDWDSYETSLNFIKNTLLKNQSLPIDFTVEETYAQIRQEWHAMTDEMRQLEEENNSIFLEAFDLENALSPDVSLEEITLTCNPHYRFKGITSDEKHEVRLLEDTIKEFISYAVGCMFGRYALEKDGLILANQGETLHDYMRQIPEPQFMPCENNILPILDDEWFEDDIVVRFKYFLKVAFGGNHYDENLRFIEESLGKDLRVYFLKDFYKDHVKTYKKRPIYWQFSSAKGNFNALIYMHRYQSEIASAVLSNYLRVYRQKLNAQWGILEQLSGSASASAREKVAAVKEMDAIAKVQAELKDYEESILYPLATRQIEIDLDDGVKVNYAKFGKALKKI